MGPNMFMCSAQYIIYILISKENANVQGISYILRNLVQLNFIIIGNYYSL